MDGRKILMAEHAVRPGPIMRRSILNDSRNNAHKHHLILHTLHHVIGHRCRMQGRFLGEAVI